MVDRETTRTLLLNRNREDLLCFMYDTPEFKGLYKKLSSCPSHPILVKHLVQYISEDNPDEFSRLKALHRWVVEKATLLDDKLTLLRTYKLDIPYNIVDFLATRAYICIITETCLYFHLPLDGKAVQELTTKEIGLLNYKISTGAIDVNNTIYLRCIPSSLGQNAHVVALRNTGVLWSHEATSASISPLTIDDQGFVCFIQTQNSSQLVRLDTHTGNVDTIIDLDTSYHLSRDCTSFIAFEGGFCIALYQQQKGQNLVTILFIETSTSGQIYSINIDTKGLPLTQFSKDETRVYFGTAPYWRSQTPNKIYALDVTKQKIDWTFVFPSTYDGRHKPVCKNLIIADDMIFAAEYGNRIYGIDRKDGQQVWLERMSGQIDVGLAKTDTHLIAFDNTGELKLWPFAPKFAVACHYNLDSPPILGEWSSVVLTIANIGLAPTDQLILQISGDIDGESENSTQVFNALKPNDYLRRSVRINPQKPGKPMHLTVSIFYKAFTIKILHQSIPIALAVRRSPSSKINSLVEAIRSQNRDYIFNLVALNALLTITLQESRFKTFCARYFPDLLTEFHPGMRIDELHLKLIDYIITHNQIEFLLTHLETHYAKWYKIYINEIKKRYHPKYRSLLAT